MRRLLPVACLLLSASRAWGHHVIAESGATPVVPMSIVGVDAASATYDLGGVEGSWTGMLTYAELSWGERLSVSGALPVAQIRPRDGEARTGIGDASLAAKLSVWQDRHGARVLAVGLGLELPTGDHDAGLGGGHWELAPFVAGSAALAGNRIILWALAAGSFSLGGHHHHHGLGGSVLAPHANRELNVRGMATWMPNAWYFGVGGEGTAWTDAGGRWVAVRTEVGVRFVQRWRVTAGLDAGVWGQERYGVRGRMGVARWF